MQARRRIPCWTMRQYKLTDAALSGCRTRLLTWNRGMTARARPAVAWSGTGWSRYLPRPPRSAAGHAPLPTKVNGRGYRSGKPSAEPWTASRTLTRLSVTTCAGQSAQACGAPTGPQPASAKTAAVTRPDRLDAPGHPNARVGRMPDPVPGLRRLGVTGERCGGDGEGCGDGRTRRPLVWGRRVR